MLRVLHLPSNIASQISNMVRGLRALGVDARGVTLSRHHFQSSEAVTEILIPQWRRSGLAVLPEAMRSYWDIAREMFTADVVHWHGASNVLPRGLDAVALSRRAQGRFVTFWGSEIRIPEIAVQGNPYAAELLSSPDCSYAISFKKSRTNQERFAERGFQCIVPGPELLDHIQRDLFPRVHCIETTIYMPDLESTEAAPKPPSASGRPRVVHTPSNQVIKGTRKVIEIVERLQRTIDFDFQLIHGVSHQTALEKMRDADIVLDQFVFGSYGTVALEAMGLGKVTVCYLTDAVRRRIHESCPIVNASYPTLADTLARLLRDKELRGHVGGQGKEYVRAFHSVDVVAPRLLAMYRGAAGAQGRWG